MTALCALLLIGAADVKAVDADGVVTFTLGDEVIAAYRHRGVVREEKGPGTKPLAKPFFFPLHAPGGVPVTRAWPLERGKPGETKDHFHQKSAWFGHGDVIPEGLELKTRTVDEHVKGVDFWSEAKGHGRIVCVKVKIEGNVVTDNEWRTADGAVILDERRTLTVTPLEKGTLIALNIELTAKKYDVTFGDTKEGTLGVRVPDGFRLNQPASSGVVTSSDGTTAKPPAKENLPMWGQTADWHDYSGTVDGKPAGVAIFADPKNAHAAAWHTRAYGLLAANPFGRDKSGFPAMKGRKDEVRLKKGESLSLRYAIYTHTGDAKTGQVAEAFAKFR